MQVIELAAYRARVSTPIVTITHITGGSDGRSSSEDTYEVQYAGKTIELDSARAADRYVEELYPNADINREMLNVSLDA